MGTNQARSGGRPQVFRFKVDGFIRDRTQSFAAKVAVKARTVKGAERELRVDLKAQGLRVSSCELLSIRPCKPRAEARVVGVDHGDHGQGPRDR